MCHDLQVTLLNRPATIRDVAKHAQVSVATVSRVLNGVPSVRSESVHRVMEAVSALQYVPNLSARDFRRQSSRGWAVIVPDIQNSFFTKLVAALEEEALRAGLHIMLCNSNEDLERERTYIEAAVSDRVAGVVIAVVSAQLSSVEQLDKAGIPVVLVDRRLKGFTGVMIGCNNVAAGRSAAIHLLAQGVRKPLLLGGPADVPTTEDRLQGFLDEMNRNGITVGDDQVLRYNLIGADSVTAMTRDFARLQSFDAVFAANGTLTASAYRALQVAKQQVPAEVKLVGVDDDQWTKFVHPSISVVEQPVYDMGIVAGQVLTGKLPPSNEHNTILLEPRLIVRESSTGLE